MRERATALAVATGLAIAGIACGGAETNVVNQYFTALRAHDTNTLTSFALVAFDKKVDDYKIVSVGPEQRAPATLPDLVKKQAEIQEALDANMKEARAWGNDLKIYPKLDRVRALERDGKKIPASLQPIHEKWTAYNDRDRELKGQIADAKRAVEKERHNEQMSVGQLEGLEKMTGEVISRKIDLSLTIDGQPKPYVMTLRKYELNGEDAGRRVISRWVVENLEPKA
jgi:hypothetical protein